MNMATSPRYYSKSEFNLLFRDPKAWFRRYVLGEKVEPTPSMIEGRNFHAYIFHYYLKEYNESVLMDQDLKYGDIIPKKIHVFKGEIRKKEAKEEWERLNLEAEKTGDLVLREKELESLKLMYHAIRENEFVHNHLKNCAQNASFEYWLKRSLSVNDTGFVLTGRADGIYSDKVKNTIFDLKKLNSVDGGTNPDEFVKKAGLDVLFDCAFYKKLACTYKTKEFNKTGVDFFYFVVNPPVVNSKGEVKTPARCFYVEPDSKFEEASMKALYDLLPYVRGLYELEEEELASRIKSLLEGGVGATPSFVLNKIRKKVKDLKGLV